jgi:nicotinamidase/pyrazinamidase
MGFLPGPNDALLIVDMQNDFCPRGALAVAEGDAILPTVNALAERFEHVLLTQDWHPEGHISFASSHAGRKPYEQIEVGYGPQTLWPVHCVQGSAGAEFHAQLNVPRAELVLRKGFHPGIDSYSAFLENDQRTATGLAGYLRDRGIGRLFLCGLAYDFCVRFSAVDGTALGFECVVVEDACRAVGLPGSVEVTRAAFAEAGVKEIQASALLG